MIVHPAEQNWDEIRWSPEFDQGYVAFKVYGIDQNPYDGTEDKESRRRWRLGFETGRRESNARTK